MLMHDRMKIFDRIREIKSELRELLRRDREGTDEYATLENELLNIIKSSGLYDVERYMEILSEKYRERWNYEELRKRSRVAMDVGKSLFRGFGAKRLELEKVRIILGVSKEEWKEVMERVPELEEEWKRGGILFEDDMRGSIVNKMIGSQGDIGDGKSMAKIFLGFKEGDKEGGGLAKLLKLVDSEGEKNRKERERERKKKEGRIKRIGGGG